MKKILLLLITFIIGFSVYAQRPMRTNAVQFRGFDSDNALFETTNSDNASMYWNSLTQTFRVFNGTTWSDFSSGGTETSAPDTEIVWGTGSNVSSSSDFTFNDTGNILTVNNGSMVSDRPDLGVHMSFRYLGTNYMTLGTAPGYSGSISSFGTDPFRILTGSTTWMNNTLSTNTVAELDALEVTANGTAGFNGSTFATIDWVNAQGFGGGGTDSQTLSYTYPNLAITGGNSVDLSDLRDGNTQLTEAQVDAYANNNGYLRADIASTKSAGTLTFADDVKLQIGTTSTGAEGRLKIQAGATDNVYFDLGTTSLVLRDQANAFAIEHIFNVNGDYTATGNITGNSFIKSGATSDDVLLGNGTTTSLAGIGGGGSPVSLANNTVIQLDNTINSYYTTSASTANTFTFANDVLGGKATVLIDTTGDSVFPTVTGATFLPSAPFTAGQTYLMNLFTTSTTTGTKTTYYYFVATVQPVYTFTASDITDFDTEVANNTTVTSNTAFTTTPSSVITAGTNLTWSSNTLNATEVDGSITNEIQDLDNVLTQGATSDVDVILQKAGKIYLDVSNTLTGYSSRIASDRVYASNGTDIVSLKSGANQSLTYDIGIYDLNINAPTTLGATRNITWQDGDGTVAFTSDIPTDYVDKTSAETIGGIKTFSSRPVFNTDDIETSGGDILALPSETGTLAIEREQFFEYALSGEDDAFPKDNNALTVRTPFAFTLTDVRINTTTSGTFPVTLNILKNGVTIFATNITIDTGETTSVTATTAYNFTASAPSVSFADDDIIVFDIDSNDGGATGLKCKLYYTR